MFRKLLGRLGTGRNEPAPPLPPQPPPPSPNASSHAEAAATARGHRDRGNAALAQGRPEEALANYEAAAAADPADALARLNVGYAQLELGRPGQALGSLDEALARDASLADAHYMRGQALAALGRPDDALDALRRAAAMKPDFVFAWRDLGGLQCQLGRFDAALADLDAGLRASGGDPMLLEWRGKVLTDAGRFEEALQVAGQLLQAHPQSPHLWSNLGMLQYRLERFPEALEACSRAVALPNPAATHFYNLGCCRIAFNDYEGLLRDAAAGLDIDPGDADLQWLCAVGWLMRGDMARGWPAYEARWARRQAQVPTRLASTQPEWDGSQSLHDKVLLVYAEQAFGDTLQFLRFLLPLQARGARLVLRLQPALVALAAGLDLPGLQVVAQDDPLPPFDLHCSLMSLPLRLGVRLQNLPGPSPYLRADAGLRAAWEQRLGPRTLPRLGLAWSGKPLPDPHRSIPLGLLLDHLPRGVQIVSLQTEVRDSDRAALASRPDIFHAGDELRSFADTAALADCVDFVLTIDTSVAHLAGALGKPMWVMLPFVPDWRWMLDREDCPWYPTATLLRQDASRAWDTVAPHAGAAVRAAVAG